MYDEVARTESERGELVLRRRTEPDGASVLELRANGVFVMDTAETSTERELARAALAAHAASRDVLVCGLGLGFTLAEVLADHQVTRCTVVEIEPALPAWLRAGVVPGREVLADPRTNVVVDDVATVVAMTEPSSYDVVLLDVDNGPGYLVHEANSAVYEATFLERLQRILRPSGILAVWSADVAPGLAATLEAVFGDCAETSYAVDLQGRDERYHVYLARREPSVSS